MEEPILSRKRSYGWQELALCYCPDISPEAASKRLRRWVDFNPEFCRELQQAGWKKGNRVLSPLQVGVIIRYLGEP